MNSNFSKRLTEYLDSECSDYGLSYSWEFDYDCNWCVVRVKKDMPSKEKTVNFRYDEKKDDLLIELSEDSFYVTREFDHTVKFFWMLVSPILY